MFKSFPSIALRGIGDNNGILHIFKAVEGIRHHELQPFIINEPHQKVKRFMPSLNGSLLIPMPKMKHFNIHFCTLGNSRPNLQTVPDKRPIVNKMPLGRTQKASSEPSMPPTESMAAFAPRPFVHSITVSCNDDWDVSITYDAPSLNSSSVYLLFLVTAISLNPRIFGKLGKDTANGRSASIYE